MRLDQIVLLITHLILMLSFAAYPLMSKKNIAFGIKIPLNAYEDKDVKRIRKQFMMITVVIGVILASLSLVITSEILSVIYIFLTVFVYFLIYLKTYKQMKRLKKDKAWEEDSHSKTVIDTEFRKRKITIPSSWYILYILIVAVTALVSILKYSGLPEVLTVQMNTYGDVTRTMPKLNALTYQIGLQVMVLVLMVFVQYIIKTAKQDLSSNNAEQSIEDNVRFRYNISKVLFVLGAVVGITLMFSVFLSINIITSLPLFLFLTLGSTLMITVIVVAYSIRFGQDGSRLTKQTPTDEDNFIDKEDDRFWKLGMLYFNKNDPSVFISKRVGVGWSLNHARWQTWIFYVSLVIFVVVISIVS